jgi:hypothetical protein
MRIRSLAWKATSPTAIIVMLASTGLARPARPQTADSVPTFDQLLAHRVRLKPELVGVHPRVFVTASELAALRPRATTTHRVEWQSALRALVSLARVPNRHRSQERRAQNNVHSRSRGQPRVRH